MSQIPQGASPEVQAAFADVYATLDTLRTKNIPLGGRRVIGAGDAVDATDYVTLQQLQNGLAGKGLTPTKGGVTPVVSPAAPSGVVPLDTGGTNAVLVANTGGVVYSTASAMAILAGTATARQMLQSGANAAPAWSTATWPATTTINQLLYSSAANVVAGLAVNATATKKYLQQVSSGAPAWQQVAAADLSDGVTGTGAIVLAGSPALTGTPTAPTAAPGTNTTQLATTAFVAAAGGSASMSGVAARIAVHV